MTDLMREEFEAWAAEEAEVRGVGALLGLMTDENHDRYSMIWTQTAWMAWQASRAAIEVELPLFTEFAASDSPCYVLSRCSDMLTHQGLKVKS